jgi:hypothetical protein
MTWWAHPGSKAIAGCYSLTLLLLHFPQTDTADFGSK